MINKKLKEIKKGLFKVAKDSSLNKYSNKIKVEVTMDSDAIMIDINIVGWEIYVELPSNILDEENKKIYNDYIEAITYAIENHSRDINLEYYINPNKYQVKTSVENIRLDI